VGPGLACFEDIILYFVYNKLRTASFALNFLMILEFLDLLGPGHNLVRRDEPGLPGIVM
jgi:hypothetical protein